MNTLLVSFNLQTSLQNNQSVSALIADHLSFRETLEELGIYDAEAEAQALTDIALDPVIYGSSDRYLPIAC